MDTGNGIPVQFGWHSHAHRFLQSPAGTQKQQHCCCWTVHWGLLIIPPVPGNRECNSTKEQAGTGCKKGFLPQPFMDAQKLLQSTTRRDLNTFWCIKYACICKLTCILAKIQASLRLVLHLPGLPPIPFS